MSTHQSDTQEPEIATCSALSINGQSADAIYMRRIQAGEYLKQTYGFCSATLLSKLATIGGGPAFSRMGRLNLYQKSDLDNWALSKIGPKYRSTYDASASVSAK